MISHHAYTGRGGDVMRRKRNVLISVFMLLVLLCGSLPPAVHADTAITWPAGAKVISEEMFYGNSAIDRVMLPEGVLEIQADAFVNSSLREISLPSTITNIVGDPFVGSHLQTVHATKGTYAYQWAREKGYLVEYRALVIGERTFLRDDPDDRVIRRNVGDANEMTKMLKRVYGPLGTKYSVNQRINLSFSEIEDQIRSTFTDTMDQDVSLFFIATHGNDRGDGDLEMPYLGDQEDEAATAAFNSSGRWLSFDVLASWLNQYVKGKVIVILESCGSGSAIYSDEVAENSVQFLQTNKDFLLEGFHEGTVDGDTDTFAVKAIQAFEETDLGVANETGGAGKKGNGTGSMRQENKFYVLAASRHHEQSYGYKNDASVSVVMNFFTLWLIRGIGKAGSSPADVSPADGILTLRELFGYINKNGKVNGKTMQHVQCYPQNSRFECFLLK